MNMQAPLRVEVLADARPHILYRDIETRSKLSLKKVGVHVYAADPSTEILSVAFAVDDGAVQVWHPGDPVPPEFYEAAPNPSWSVCAHGDAFESVVEIKILGPRYCFPIVPLEYHRCTQTMCRVAGLPSKLSLAADAFELMYRKDADGERLMHQMSKPRRARQGEDPAGTYYYDDAERLQRLDGYNIRDVEVTRELYYRLPPLSAAEQALWVSSCRMKRSQPAIIST